MSREVNVYDFDNTIFKGDSTVRFLMFLIGKHPPLARYGFVWLYAAVRYKLGIMDKTEMKQRIYSIFASVPDVEKLVAEFWMKNSGRIKDFYYDRHRGDDIVISASPEFLLKGICAELGIGLLIASRVDPETGRYIGKNCHGQEKVTRLRELEPEIEIGEFFSDSHSDDPLAELAREAFLVKGEKLLAWK